MVRQELTGAAVDATLGAAAESAVVHSLGMRSF
jgi:hypothetical protein